MNMHDWIPTRASLLSRLRDWDDSDSWQQFFDIYGKLLHSVALKAGLTESEAQDVVQETVIKVADKLRTFHYDPAIGSFKGWLLMITRSRVIDSLRRRGRRKIHTTDESDTSGRTPLIERIPDPESLNLDAVWEREWREKMLEAAKERIRKKVSPKHFQIYDCYVCKQWAPEKVAQYLRIEVSQVYLVKHRLATLVKQEVRNLEAKGF